MLRLRNDVCLSLNLMLVERTIRILRLGVERRISSLLRRLFLDLTLGNLSGTQSLQLRLGPLHLNLLLQLRISHLRLALRINLVQAHTHVELCLAVGKLRISLRLLAATLRLKNRGFCIDTRDFLLRLGLLLGFTDLTSHASLRDVDLGLVLRAFMSLAAEERKVLAARGILEFLDVGIVADSSVSLNATKVVTYILRPNWSSSFCTLSMTFCLNTSLSLKISSIVMLETITRVSPSIMPLTMS